MRKIALLLAVLFTMVLCAPSVLAADTALPFEITAKAVYLVNLNTDKVVYEKNAEERMYPASTTKLMTCIMLLESGYDLDTTEVTAPRYVYDEFAGKNVSTGDIRQGEVLTLRELAYAMMLQSANEAASIVADFLGDGSIPYFGEMMTQRAKELGCTGTNFVNPHGLYDPNHYTTAKDMYLLAKHAFSLPDFQEIVSTRVFDLRPTNIHQTLKWITTNSMTMQSSKYYYEPMVGGKTGTTEESGRCFVSMASQNGYDYLCVDLGSRVSFDENGYYVKDENNVIVNEAFADTKKLYEWAFANFTLKTLVEKGREVTEVPLKLASDLDHMKLVSAERFAALVPVNVEPSSLVKRYDLPDYITAPVRKGDQVGSMRLILMDEEIGSVPILASQTVERSNMVYLVELGKLILMSYWFKFVAIFLVVFIGLYATVMVIRNRNLRRYRADIHRPKK